MRQPPAFPTSTCKPPISRESVFCMGATSESVISVVRILAICYRIPLVTRIPIRSAVLVFVAGLALLAQQRWYPHEGGLMKYRVQIRFGEEPDTMPDGWKFGRVS